MSCALGFTRALAQLVLLRLFLPTLNADLPAYCSAPATGAEGLLEREGYSLQKVIVTARHGDRSAIHHSDGEVRAVWSCKDHVSVATYF